MAVGHNSLKVAYVVWAFTFKAAQPHIKPFSFLPFLSVIPVTTVNKFACCERITYQAQF